MNETWDLVSFPKGKHVIVYRRVYKLKHKTYGRIEGYNAKLAKEYAHTYGIDDEETLSLVTKMATMKCHYNGYIKRLDIASNGCK